MFSRRRRKYKNVVWASILTAVALLSLVLLLGYLSSFRDNSYKETVTNENIAVESERQNETLSKETSEQEVALDDKKKTYYLLKYDNDVVKVYFSDQQGKLTELEATDIVYDVLSPDDQIQFQEGIQVESRDALNMLLMDYES